MFLAFGTYIQISVTFIQSYTLVHVVVPSLIPIYIVVNKSLFMRI